MTDEKQKEFAVLCALSAKNKTLKNFVLSSSSNKEIQKVKGTLKKFSDKEILQLEYFCTEGRVRQENIEISNTENAVGKLIGDFSRCDLNDSGGTASLMRSKKGKITLIRHGNIGKGEAVEATGDKIKNYILDGNEEFLFHLGISDKSGRIHDKKPVAFAERLYYAGYRERACYPTRRSKAPLGKYIVRTCVCNRGGMFRGALGISACDR